MNVNNKIPRQYSIVKLVEGSYEQEAFMSFGLNSTLIFLGEIPNMPGHCIILEYSKICSDTRIHAFWHTDNFVECTEEEV